jgi:SsrA-binding protein
MDRKMNDNKKDSRIIADNRKARHDYFVEEVYEAGVELFGTEVKSLRAGAVNLKDSYCEIDGGEMFALGVHISPYDHGNIFNRDPLRPKKLLLHKREIMKLTGLISRDGYTLVPLSLYFKGSYVKMAIGLCKGKKLYDKRDSIAKRESDRIIEREMKNRRD